MPPKKNGAEEKAEGRLSKILADVSGARQHDGCQTPSLSSGPIQYPLGAIPEIRMCKGFQKDGKGRMDRRCARKL